MVKTRQDDQKISLMSKANKRVLAIFFGWVVAQDSREVKIELQLSQRSFRVVTVPLDVKVFVVVETVRRRGKDND